MQGLQKQNAHLALFLAVLAYDREETHDDRGTAERRRSSALASDHHVKSRFSASEYQVSKSEGMHFMLDCSQCFGFQSGRMSEL